MLPHKTIAILSALFVITVTHCYLVADDKLERDALFDQGKLLEIEIELKEKDWKELCGQSRNFFTFLAGMPQEKPYNYFEGTIWINGKKIERVGIRKKGFLGSQDGVRPSLKISFDEFHKQKPVKGLNRLTLNNNKQDTSQVSQVLTYDLFRKIGVKAPLANLAKVSVNGVNLGIYTNVESVKKTFLKRAFDNDKGNLYEGTVGDFYPNAIEGLEAKTNKKKNDRTQIKELAELLYSDDLTLAEISQRIDIDYFFKFWVVEGLIRYWDGYSANQNNYFYYFNPENGRGYFIPWGADASFLQNGGPFNTQKDFTCFYANAALSNRLFHLDGVPERFKNEMKLALDKVWKEDELIAKIDNLIKLFKNDLHKDQKRDVKNAVEQVKTFIKLRRGVVEKELAVWPPEVAEKPRKPVYGVTIGSLTGSFQTTWRDKRSRNPTKEGMATLELKMNDEEIVFSQLGAVVQKFRMPTFGIKGMNPDPPVDVVLAGIRKSDGKRMTMSLYVDMDTYLAKESKPIKVYGSLSVGRGGSFAALGNRSTRTLEGTMEFKESGAKAGQKVEGKMKLDVIEMRGGIFRR